MSEINVKIIYKPTEKGIYKEKELGLIINNKICTIDNLFDDTLACKSTDVTFDEYINIPLKDIINDLIDYHLDGYCILADEEIQQVNNFYSTVNISEYEVIKEKDINKNELLQMFDCIKGHKIFDRFYYNMLKDFNLI